jgi:hypothetical protein
MINVFSNNDLNIPLPKMAVHSKHSIIYCRGLQTGTLPAISPDYGPVEGVVSGAGKLPIPWPGPSDPERLKHCPEQAGREVREREDRKE